MVNNHFSRIPIYIWIFWTIILYWLSNNILVAKLYLLSKSFPKSQIVWYLNIIKKNFVGSNNSLPLHLTTIILITMYYVCLASKHQMSKRNIQFQRKYPIRQLRRKFCYLLWGQNKELLFSKMKGGPISTFH